MLNLQTKVLLARGTPLLPPLSPAFRAEAQGPALCLVESPFGARAMQASLSRHCGTCPASQSRPTPTTASTRCALSALLRLVVICHSCSCRFFKAAHVDASELLILIRHGCSCSTCQGCQRCTVRCTIALYALVYGHTSGGTRAFSAAFAGPGVATGCREMRQCTGSAQSSTWLAQKLALCESRM